MNIYSKKKSFVFISLFAAVGVFFLWNLEAATNNYFIEPETSIVSGCAKIVSGDSSAANGASVKFGEGGTCDQGNESQEPWANAGAKLPITYDLAAIGGKKIFISPNGSDSSGSGTQASPFASLNKAYTSAVSGDSVIIRGGIYRGQTINAGGNTKTVSFMAYPGEKPIFNGAKTASASWTTEGNYSWQNYSPMAVTNGSGINFTGGENLVSDSNGDYPGKYPDQAWVGDVQLRQVTAKKDVAAGKFWVDATNNRIYLHSSDVSQGNIEYSDMKSFMSIWGPNTLVKGLTITRYSNGPADYGIIKVYETADNSLIENIDVSNYSFLAMSYIGSSNLNLNNTLSNSTFSNGNWMGIAILYTDNFTMDKVEVKNLNEFGEFTSSPQSGAIKTSRTHFTKITNNYIHDNKSQGVWFDESNYAAEIANNSIENNTGSGIFYEISDKAWIINNYVKSTGGARPVKLAGSSGLILINNTIIGGADPIGIYTDNRSIEGCSVPGQPVCDGAWTSNRDSVRPYASTMTWKPALDYMVNNIVAYPTSAGYCGSSVLCITSTNAAATVPINEILHKADNAKGIPQTFMNANVYANGSGRLIGTPIGSYTTLSSFTTSMNGSPVGISGLESAGLSGNTYVNSDGSPTTTLKGKHSEAFAVPVDPVINKYVPAGTKHYGVLYK